MTGQWPLTPFEEYIFYQDRPAYPWDFHVRLDFVGDLDSQAADLALRKCVCRHPLLRSLVQSDSRRRLIWQPTQAAPQLRWETRRPPGVYPTATRIDVRRETGLRVLAAKHQDGTECFFQFHHACCDARGALGFLEDWLIEYGQLTAQGEIRVEPTSCDPTRLKHRGVLRRKPQSILRAMREHSVRLARTYQFLARSPVPLVDYVPALDDCHSSADSPAVRSFRFDEAATSRIKSEAQRRGVTVNDLLCRDLFVAIDRFQQSVQMPPGDPWLRLMIPVDLRDHAPRALSAANVLSLVFLNRRRSACRNPRDLLHGIHCEMAQLKKGSLSRAFLAALRVRKRFAGGLQRSAQSTRYGTTAVLTNVGETFARSPLMGERGRLTVGLLELRGVDFVAPIGPSTCVSVAACTYAGRLTINLHYDPRAIDCCDADRLLTYLTAAA